MRLSPSGDQGDGDSYLSDEEGSYNRKSPIDCMKNKDKDPQNISPKGDDVRSKYKTKPSGESTRYDSTLNELPRTLGINGLVKAFERTHKSRGTYDDDIERCIRRFLTQSRMFGALDDENLTAIQIMLKGAALDFFDEYQEGCSNHEDSFELLSNWYNSQRARILSKWKNIRLTEEMAKNPDESEIPVFRGFVAQVVTLQKS